MTLIKLTKYNTATYMTPSKGIMGPVYVNPESIKYIEGMEGHGNKAKITFSNDEPLFVCETVDDVLLKLS